MSHSQGFLHPIRFSATFLLWLGQSHSLDFNLITKYLSLEGEHPRPFVSYIFINHLKPHFDGVLHSGYRGAHACLGALGRGAEWETESHAQCEIDTIRILGDDITGAWSKYWDEWEDTVRGPGEWERIKEVLSAISSRSQCQPCQSGAHCLGAWRSKSLSSESLKSLQFSCISKGSLLSLSPKAWREQQVNIAFRISANTFSLCTGQTAP